MAEFRLSYTANEINARLGKIDNISWNDLKDKPFWETTETIEILPEQDVVFPLVNGYITNIPIDATLVQKWVGGFSVATIVWDGLIYECSPQSIQGILAVGNLGLVGEESSSEPFGALAATSAMTGEGDLLALMDVASAIQYDAGGGPSEITHRVGISIKRSIIKKIDEKFIPFEREIDILPLQDLQEMAYSDAYGCFETTLIAPANLMLGETYIVYWDGARYECACHDGSSLMEGAVFVGNGSPFGLPSNNEPFIIGTPDDKSGFMFLSMTDTEPTVHSVRIYKVENIIDARIDAYMEEALGGDY